MINIYTWTDGTELYHHGVIGQKWGVRRYQNSDGSLTAAGKKRYSVKEGLSSIKDKVTSLKNKKASEKEKNKPKKEETEPKKEIKEKPKKVNIKDLSDSELTAYKNRLTLEKSVIGLENEVYGRTKMSDVKKSKAIEKGKNFVLDVGGYVLKESLKSAGKAYLEKKLKEKLGVETKDKKEDSDLQLLKNKYEKLSYTKKIKDLKNGSNTKVNMADVLEMIDDLRSKVK